MIKYYLITITDHYLFGFEKYNIFLYYMARRQKRTVRRRTLKRGTLKRGTLKKQRTMKKRIKGGE